MMIARLVSYLELAGWIGAARVSEIFNVRNFATAIGVGGFPVSLMLLLLGALSQPSDLVTQNFDLYWIVVALFLAPLLESLLLVSAIHISSQITRNDLAASLVPALLISAMHLANSWQNAVVVIWLFFVQSWSCVRIFRSGHRFRDGYLFVVLLHFSFNLLATLLIGISRMA